MNIVLIIAGLSICSSSMSVAYGYYFQTRKQSSIVTVKGYTFERGDFTVGVEPNSDSILGESSPQFCKISCELNPQCVSYTTRGDTCFLNKEGVSNNIIGIKTGEYGVPPVLINSASYKNPGLCVENCIGDCVYWKFDDSAKTCSFYKDNTTAQKSKTEFLLF